MAEATSLGKKGYRWVQEVLRERILKGEWSSGYKLPSDKELCEEFCLNRLTVNKSLVNLAAEGLIVRRKGQGTFVVDRTQRTNHLRHLVKFISPQSAGGEVPVRHGVLEGMHEVLTRGSYHVGVDFYRNVQEELELIRRNKDEYHAGFVIWCEPDERLMMELERLREGGYPFVLVDGYFPRLDADYVITDNMKGSLAVVDHLVRNGHRHITYVTRAVDRASLKDRQAGFHQGLVAHDLPIWDNSVIKLRNAGLSALAEVGPAMDDLLADSSRPTAIYFCNDDLALAAIEHLRAKGVRVPEDISVVGFDNCDRSAYGPSPLTTVAQDWFEMGKVAAEILADRIGGKGPVRPAQVLLRPELVERSSVCTRNTI